MFDDLIKREDAIKAAWGDDINPSEDGMVFEAQSHIDRDIRRNPSQTDWKCGNACEAPWYRNAWSLPDDWHNVHQISY